MWFLTCSLHERSKLVVPLLIVPLWNLTRRHVLFGMQSVLLKLNMPVSLEISHKKPDFWLLLKNKEDMVILGLNSHMAKTEPVVLSLLWACSLGLTVPTSV